MSKHDVLSVYSLSNDLRVFAKNKDENDCVASAASVISHDTGMGFREEKCGVTRESSRKITLTDGENIKEG